MVLTLREESRLRVLENRILRQNLGCKMDKNGVKKKSFTMRNIMDVPFT
jgi:hypothetical protein